MRDEMTLAAVYVVTMIFTFFHSCYNALYSDMTSMLVMSIFAGMFWPIYWILYLFGVENPTLAIWGGWIIIGTSIVAIYWLYEKIKKALQR